VLFLTHDEDFLFDRPTQATSTPGSTYCALDSIGVSD
jgi:hypothetical protein